MKLTWPRHSSARSAGAALVLAASLVFAAGCQFNSSADTATAAPDTAQTLATSAPAATAAPAAATAMPAAATAAPEPTAAPAATAAPDAAAGINPAAFTTVIRDVARNVRPGVVQITNQQVQLDQFNQAFTVPAGVGSGVIYDDQGHILTNNHVVEGAQKLLVSLPDGRSFPGTLVGQDPQTDLAVVQIKADNLPIVPLGNSHDLQIGDWVVAIGNALALQGGPTVSQGVVSALGRTVQEPGTDQNTAGPFLFDAIQTDAPINPGNSGGPLVNLNGQVVGINTLVAGQAEPGVPAQGIGFAIAIDTAKPIADELVSTGHVAHAYLGIRYIPLNPAIASQLGVNTANGVVISNVVNGSPAAQAGLQPRDVITEVDGQKLNGDSGLADATNGKQPGDTITLTVLRQGQTAQIKVTLGTLPS